MNRKARYYEVCEHELYNRGQIYQIHEIDKKPRDFHRSVSIYPYSGGISGHLINTATEEKPQGSVAGYKGTVWLDDLFFDLDSHQNLPIRATRALVSGLMEVYGIPKHDIYIYFSGNKGFHVRISAAHIGGAQFDTAANIANTNRRFAIKVRDTIQDWFMESTGQEDILEPLDLQIYNPGRLLRIKNSKHPKSGLYKIPLHLSELNPLRGEKEIRELAKEPRTDFVQHPSNKPQAKPKLKAEWVSASFDSEYTPVDLQLIAELDGKDDKELFATAMRIISGEYNEKNVRKGTFHDFHMKIGRICANLGIGAPNDSSIANQLILDWRINVNGEDASQIDQKAQARRIKSCYEYVGHRFGQKLTYSSWKQSMVGGLNQTRQRLLERLGKLKRAKMPDYLLNECMLGLNSLQKSPLSRENLAQLIIEHTDQGKGDRDRMPATLESYLDEYIDYIARDRTKIGTGIPNIDEAAEYDFEGKSLAIIGSSGTGKSYFQQTVASTMAMNGQPNVIFSMEDNRFGVLPRLVKRARDLIFTDNHPEDRFHLLREEAKENPTEAKRKIRDAITLLMEENLFFDDKTGITEEELVRDIDHLCSLKPLKGVHLDGLSAMGGRGSEYEKDINNSYLIRDIAKDYNLFVTFLVHNSKNTPREQKRQHDSPRNGPKITQNSDYSMTLSTMLAEDYPDYPNDGQYVKGYCYYHFLAKRGKGATAEGILKFNETYGTVEPVKTEKEKLQEQAPMVQVVQVDTEQGDFSFDQLPNFVPPQKLNDDEEIPF